MRNYLVLDIATSGLENVRDYLTPAAERSAPGNYSKPEAIAKWQAEDFEKDVARAGLDMDLARIIGFAFLKHDMAGEEYTDAMLCKDETDEHRALVRLSELTKNVTLVSYNGLHFDWPLLMRRARYRNVSFPRIDCDRYRSPHIDVMAVLSGGNRERNRSLAFYVRRLGWTDLTKALTGAEESQVPVSGRWDELAASMRHDVEATRRLGEWAGVL